MQNLVCVRMRFLLNFEHVLDMIQKISFFSMNLGLYNYEKFVMICMFIGIYDNNFETFHGNMIR